MSILEVERLEKEFVRGWSRRRVKAVDDISFSVGDGEIFGFLGPNGAGKTTTMKIAMGLILATSGRVRLLGFDAGDVRAKQKIGYLPENPYFYDHLSAIEFLIAVGRLFGLNRKQARERAGGLLERLDVAAAKDRPMRGYSKGMLQRVGLAQTLMGDPQLVVLDEPMSGLDPIGRRSVRQLLQELRNAGKTVFFSTHILADANVLCDRVAIIVRGKLRAVGKLGELLHSSTNSIDLLWRGPADLRERVRSAFGGQHSSTSEGETYAARDQDEGERFVKTVVVGGGHLLQMHAHHKTLEEVFILGVEGEETQR